jgi:hypothetical protein
LDSPWPWGTLVFQKKRPKGTVEVRSKYSTILVQI